VASPPPGLTKRCASFTEEAFQDLCFDFGIELDEDDEDDPERPKDRAPVLKIEIPANRVSFFFCGGATINVENTALGLRSS
jgi:phenylalanyl-tRNA synthetase beta chain